MLARVTNDETAGPVNRPAVELLRLVRMRGLEPPRCHHHRLLRPARLPVPPHPRMERVVIMRTGLEGVNREELSEEGGVLIAFSGEMRGCDSGASCGDCCPSGGRDCVARAGSNELTTMSFFAVRGRPNVRHEHRGS